MVSILDSIKQLLGIGSDDTSFDAEIIMDINGALMIMNQLGVGPIGGFSITSKTDLWTDFLGARTDLDLVRPAVFLRVKLLFDPPANSFLVASIEKQLQEYDWRIEFAHKPPIIPIVEPEE